MAMSSRLIICSNCGREKPVVNARLNLCNSCHVQEYKKRTGYKGPVRVCCACGKVTNIHSKNMCHHCYNKDYAQKHREELNKKKNQNRKINPQKFRDWDNNWRWRNHGKYIEHQRQYYHENIEKMRANKRLYYRRHREEILKKILANRIAKGNNHKFKKVSDNELILLIPEMKRKWVIEFLNTIYKNRADCTKHKFLLDITRLLIYIKENNSESYNGGWNLVSLTDIEDCQVDTGLLKDSLRIFFKWLKKRKYLTVDLSSAIPTGTRKWSFSEISVENLSDYVNKFYSDDVTLETKIVGLLIVYYLCSVDQLRSLTIDDFKDCKIFINNEWQPIDDDLWGLIEQYLSWREKQYFRYAPKWFFITGYNVTSQERIEIGHFSRIFERNNIGITPKDLRKAMIFYHKNHTGMDPFELAAIAGIQPRSATRY